VVSVLAAGGAHTCAIVVGGVKCWGDNYYGQLGLGDRTPRGTVPTDMGDALPFVDLRAARPVAVAAGLFHTCVLLDDGHVQCWGGNQFGQLGLGDVTNRGDDPSRTGGALVPVDLGGDESAVAIAAGAYHTCAILGDGRLKCWGANDHGQLGVDRIPMQGDSSETTGDRLAAVKFEDGLKTVAVAAGAFHTCALREGGDLYCWGANMSGQLGVGTQTDVVIGSNVLTHLDLGAGRFAVSVAAGASHTCAVLDDRSVRCWGLGAFGQLGLEDPRNRGDDAGEMGDALPPIALGTLAGGALPADVVTAGAYHTCALLATGDLKCWGRNGLGQLGLGDIRDRGDDPLEMGDALPAVDLLGAP
jgi:alpha-tubulin suppressor-like RCC1 family protein